MQAAHKTGFIALGLLAFLTSVDSQASDTVELAGDVLRFVLPATGAGLALAHKDGTGALQLSGSVALTLGVTYGLKYAIDEERPNGGKHSFPSGHASLSFASAEFIRKRYGWKYSVPAYAVASFVAYSRVESEQHHAHDVVAGAAIGILSSYLFTTPYKGWHVGIENNGKYHGIRLTRIW